MNCFFHHDREATAYCRTCGKALCDECKRDVRGVIYCEPCIAARLQDTMPSASPPGPSARVVVEPSGPNPALAAILGFIPGVGAMYNGQFAKGLLHVVIFAALIGLADHAEFFGVLVGFFYIYMIFEAYITARARLHGEPLPDPFGFNRLTGQAAMSDLSRAPVGALILIGLGVLFLLDNLGIHAFRWVGHFWPVILIAIGVWLIARRGGSGAVTPNPPTTPSGDQEQHHG